MNSLSRLFTLSIVMSCASLAGCAAESAEDAEETEADTAELSSAGKALIGSYQGGATLQNLELTATKVGSANAFTADLDTGIRCVAAPCPEAQLHLEGTFTAGPATITFKTTNPNATAARFVGRYRYVANGATLALSRAGVTETLEKVAPRAPGPLGTCPTGTFTQAFADTILATVSPVPGNTDRLRAPAFKRELAQFQGRKWTRAANGQWSSSAAQLDGYRGGLYLGNERSSGAFEVVVHARTNRYVSASSSAGELRRYVFFQGAFDARPGTAEVAGPVTLGGNLSESPWGSFGSPPAPLTFSGQVRFTDHCFSMLDAPVTAATTQVNEAFATF
jgi:hypothetical protein